MGAIPERFPELPMLAAPSAELESFVKEIISTKYAVDELSAEVRFARTFLAEPYAEVGGVDPHSFAEYLVPFLGLLRMWPRISEDRYLARVPTGAVIGLSWRWSPKSSLTPDGRGSNEELLMKLQDQAENFISGRAPYSINISQYIWIPELGFAYAHEGKNRVSLYRTCGADFIPAQVTNRHYPSPDHITLYDTSHGLFAILDKHWIFRAQNYVVTRGLMERYGVEVRQSWPDDFPLLEDVIKGFNSKFHSNEIQISNTLDRYALEREITAQKARENKGLRRVNACLLELKEVKISAKWLYTSIAAFTILLLLTQLFPSGKIATGMLTVVGGICGFWMSLACKCFTTQQQNLKD